MSQRVSPDPGGCVPRMPPKAGQGLTHPARERDAQPAPASLGLTPGAQALMPPATPGPSQSSFPHEASSLPWVTSSVRDRP